MPIQVHPQAEGRVEVTAQPLRPDPAKLRELGLNPDDVETPVAIERRAPEYPEPARLAGIEGLVTLRCVIQTAGNVDQCDVTKALTPECDAAALAAVTQWKYTPTKVKGIPTAAYVTISFSYRLVAAPKGAE